MSNYENLNQEALDAQQQYEVEQKEVSGVQVSMNDRQPVSTQVNTEHAPKRVREGWNMKSEGFWTFNNYDNLPAEYKVFIPRAQTKSKNYPNGTVEPIVHQDPFDGQTYKYGVTFFENGGTSVWSRLYDPNKPSYSGGGYKKSFYLDVGVKHCEEGEANALLSSNEGEPTYRYKENFQPIIVNQVVNGSDGTKAVISKVIHFIHKQKRIEYGS